MFLFDNGSVELELEAKLCNFWNTRRTRRFARANNNNNNSNSAVTARVSSDKNYDIIQEQCHQH